MFNGQWTEVATAFGQIAAAVKTRSPQAVNVLADVINHNTEVMGRIIAPDANDAAGQTGNNCVEQQGEETRYSAFGWPVPGAPECRTG